MMNRALIVKMCGTALTSVEVWRRSRGVPGSQRGRRQRFGNFYLSRTLTLRKLAKKSSRISFFTWAT